MTQVTRTELLPGVYLTAVHTMKFKSSYMGIQLLTRLSEAHAAANALVPMVLRRGTERRPDMERLSAALDELYGGSVEPIVRKKGETQCVGFVASFLDDAYVPDGTPILEHAAALLGELLLTPARENGGFVSAYVERERANLVDRIQAQVNDKRSYAVLRLIQQMCAGEPYGVDRLGDESSAAAITGEALWERYQSLLSDARVELYFSGSAPFERVDAAFRSALAGLKGREVAPVSVCRKTPAEDEAPSGHRVSGRDSGQAGAGLPHRRLRCGGGLPGSAGLQRRLRRHPHLQALPQRTREAVPVLLRQLRPGEVQRSHGGVLRRGVCKREAAQSEILAQLEKCRPGEIEPWELEAARRSG